MDDRHSRFPGYISQNVGDVNVSGQSRSNVLVNNFFDPVSTLALLPSASEAAFNSYASQDAPYCLEDTRTDVLKRIRAWLRGSESAPIFWLNGMAGTGKSTIARTVAKECHDRGELGASFFFVQGGGEVERAALFFPTIAKQLARWREDARDEIIKAVRREDDIATKARLDQWNKLIAGPLNRVKTRQDERVPLLVMVVDALDECDSDDDIKGIISIFAQVQQIKTFRLRVMITSRPETPLRLGFRKMAKILHWDILLQDEPRDVVNADICLYLYEALEEVKYLNDRLPEDWPSIDSINQLVAQSDGLFIFAATVSRFIVEESQVADDALDSFLRKCQGNASLQGISPTYYLDDIYSKILERSLRYTERPTRRSIEKSDLLRTLYTIATLAEPLPASGIALLLNIPEGTVHQHLEQLHSVVAASSAGPIRFFHASFRDFLFSSNQRSNEHLSEISNDPARTHKSLAAMCLRLLNQAGSLRRDICAINRLDVNRKDVNPSIVRDSISSAISYACRYWVHHLKRSGVCMLVEEEENVYGFLQCHFLHWVECLSWLDQVMECVPILGSLQSICKEMQQLVDFLHDARRFVLRNATNVDVMPLQLYSSALVFAPGNSLIKDFFWQESMIPLRYPPTVQFEWGAEVFNLEGHTHAVTQVAFSEDGAYIATAGQYAVKVWSAATGAQIYHIDRIWKPIFDLRFPSDGSLMLGFEAWVEFFDIVTSERTAEIWNSRELSGPQNRAWDGWKQKLRETRKQSDILDMFRTGYTDDDTKDTDPEDCTFRLSDIWKTDLGKAASMLVCEPIRTITFSPDGLYLATWSRDSCIRMWRRKTGVQSGKFEGYKEPYKMTFSLDSGLIAASSSDGVLSVIATRSGDCLLHITGRKEKIIAMAFSPDSRSLVTGSLETMVEVWDVSTSRVQQNATNSMTDLQSGALRLAATDLFISPDEKFIGAADEHGTINVWDAETGGLRGTISVKWRHEPTSVMQIAPDGQIIVVRTDLHQEVWDLESAQRLLPLRPDRRWPYAIAFSPDMCLVAVAIPEDRISSKIVVCDVATGVDVIELGPCHGRFDQMCLSHDGKKLAAVLENTTVCIWDLTTSHLVGPLKYGYQWIVSISFTEDDLFLETNLFFLHTESLSTTPPRIPTETSDEVEVVGKWVTVAGNNILWLPHEYRECVKAIRGRTLVLSPGSGPVSIFRFEPS